MSDTLTMLIFTTVLGLIGAFNIKESILDFKKGRFFFFGWDVMLVIVTVIAIGTEIVKFLILT